MRLPSLRCEYCGDDMNDDTCPNYKSSCITCCIESGDICGHHQCSSTCECGYREQHGYSKDVLSPTLLILGFIFLLSIVGGIQTAGYPITP